MKKTLYTFLGWNFLLFVAGLSDIVFYRDLTSAEAMAISWTQPALVSITSFLILLSIYYGMHWLLFGKKIYLKLEVNQEDVDKMRDSIFAFLKKGEISPKNLQQHLKYLIIAEVVLWLAFIVYLFISTSTVLWFHNILWSSPIVVYLWAIHRNRFSKAKIRRGLLPTKNGKNPRRISFIVLALFRPCLFPLQKTSLHFSELSSTPASHLVPSGSLGMLLSSFSEVQRIRCSSP